MLSASARSSTRRFLLTARVSSIGNGSSSSSSRQVLSRHRQRLIHYQNQDPVTPEKVCVPLERRFFSTTPTSKDESNTTTDGKASKESLRETLHRIQNEGNEDDDNNSSQAKKKGPDDAFWNDFMHRAVHSFDEFSYEIAKAWKVLLAGGKKQELNKRIRSEDDEPYRGPLEIMVIDESENLNAWERMQKRLTEAPIIQGILEKTEEAYVKSGAQKVKRQVDDMAEDAREAWETSQNPWVYRISSVYDTMTAEHEETAAIRELRELDPDFDLHVWKKTVVEDTLPHIMRLFLEGRINALSPWLGESVQNRIAAEIAARKQEGVEIDTHVLGIMNSEILAIEPDTVEKGSPIILLHFMCQQINCVRKKKDGEIVEGAEDDIRANSYVAAFQRSYNEEEGILEWKIVDFRFNGAIAYL